MTDLKGKTAVVTGGAQGIGKAIAMKLAKAGADIAIGDVGLEAANKTAEELQGLGVNSHAFFLDVSQFDKTEEFIRQVMEKFGHIDILINNAGVTRDKLLLKMTPEDWDFVLRINLTGAFNCIKAVIPHMIKAKTGRIVNIASIIGMMGNAGQANYAASKGGLIALTKTIAKEYASRGVNVNAVAPGFIKTAMTEKIPEQLRDAMMALIPKKEYGTPEDVANAALFLSSELSSYITGQVIVVDGGMLM